MSKENFENRAEVLLEIINELACKLHPHRHRNFSITLDSHLERELGFDSLSRIELQHRVEEYFKVSLPEQALIISETPRDLLRATLSAKSAGEKSSLIETKEIRLGEAEGVPRSAQTLQEVLNWHAQSHPERPHIYFYNDDNAPEEITYSALLKGSRNVAAGLVNLGLQPGQTVAIMLPSGRDYFYSFFGIVLAGGIPVPIYPPARLSQLEDHLKRHARLLSNALATILISMEEAQSLALLLKSQTLVVRHVVTVQQLVSARGVYERTDASAQDIVFLQYTSGSTGNPKGVVLTHNELLSNIRAMGEGCLVDSTDVFVSWLPLYHDMGLIGAWLGSLYYSMPLVLLFSIFLFNTPLSVVMGHKQPPGHIIRCPQFCL